MKKHLHNFLISQFKRTFPAIYLDGICCFFISICIYMVLLIKEIPANYAGNNINQIEKNPGLLIISQITVYTRELETN